MSEPLDPFTPQKPGAKTAAATVAPVATPSNQPAGAFAPAGQSVPAFGGHRGGGKRRADGLPAGSDAAKEADRKKDRERKAAANAAKKTAALPPALPGMVAPLPDAGAPLGDSPGALPGVVAGATVITLPAPMFTAWSQKLLEKPARLLTKIADRVRCWSLMKKVHQLKLTPEQEKEISSDLRWKDEVTGDFTAALAECATVELNKRRVPGADNSHWINLAMCGGEMALVHVQTLERLEKMVAANEAAKKAAQTDKK